MARAKKKRLKVSAKAWVDKPAPGTFERPSFEVPDGKTLYKPKKGKAKLSIVPFAAGKGNPNFDSGEAAFERTYFVHRGVGAKQSSYVCLSESFGERCPICEEQRKLYKGDADDIDAAKSLAPKIRQLWNVYDHDDPKAGVQIMDMSYYLFGKLLRTRIEDQDDDDNFDVFADPDDGKILRVTWGEKSFAGNTFYEAVAIDFKDRSPLPDKVLEEAVCLDDLIKKTEYAALQKIFLEGTDASTSDSDDEEVVDESDDESDLDDEDLDDEDLEDDESDEDDSDDDDELDDDLDEALDEDDDDDLDDDDSDDGDDDLDDDDDDLDDDLDDDDEDEPPPPPKKRGRPKKAESKTTEPKKRGRPRKA